MKTYAFPLTLKRDGQSYAPGTPVPLKDDAAKKLCAALGGKPYVAGSVEPVAVKKPSGQALVKAVAQAILGLDRENEELFTQSGLPAMAVLEDALGYDITADDRAAALKLIEEKPDLFEG